MPGVLNEIVFNRGPQLKEAFVFLPLTSVFYVSDDRYAFVVLWHNVHNALSAALIPTAASGFMNSVENVLL